MIGLFKKLKKEPFCNPPPPLSMETFHFLDWIHIIGEYAQCSSSFAASLGLDPQVTHSTLELLSLFSSFSFSSIREVFAFFDEFEDHFTLGVLGFQIPYFVQGKRLGADVYLLTFLDQSIIYNQQQQAQADLDLRDKELIFLKSLINALPFPVWYKNKKNRFVLCNQSYADVVDSSISKVIANEVEISFYNSPLRSFDLSQQCLVSRQEIVHKAFMIINGQCCYVKVCFFPHMEGALGILVDLTEMWMSEEKGEDQRKSFYDLLSFLSSPVSIFDETTKLVYFNPAYLKQFEFREGFLIEQPTFSEVMEDLRERRKLPEYPDFKEQKSQALARFHESFQSIYELIHVPDGGALRVITAPFLTGGVFFIYDDVTDKFALERSYKTLIAVQKTTLDNLYEGILVLGTDFCLRLFNPAFSHLWNIQIEPPFFFFHLNDFVDKTAHLVECGAKKWKQKLLRILNDRLCEEGDWHLLDQRTIGYHYVPLPDGAHLFTFFERSFQSSLS